MDVIFLSRASTPELQRMTQDAIATCLAFASQRVNIIVMEQIEDVVYYGKGVVTVQAPKEFAYNKFANYAAKEYGSAEWIMVANNDVAFFPGWLTPLLEAGERGADLVSPKCPLDPRQKELTSNTLGDQTGKHFSGWCFVIKRELWEKIGGLDEDFTFWCADDAVVQQARRKGVTPMLVPASRVLHLGSVTAPSPPSSMTWEQVHKFEQKYGVRKFAGSRAYARWKQDKQRAGSAPRSRYQQRGFN